MQKKPWETFKEEKIFYRVKREARMQFGKKASKVVQRKTTALT